MSLYGDSNTVKGYALVSLEDKTVVGTGLIDTNSDAKALNTAVENYINAMKDKGWIAKTVDAADYVKDEAEIATAGGEQTDGKTTETPQQSQSTNGKTITGKITDIKSSVTTATPSITCRWTACITISGLPIACRCCCCKGRHGRDYATG